MRLATDQASVPLETSWMFAVGFLVALRPYHPYPLPPQVESGSGLKPLQLSASEFRLTTTLLEDAVEPQ